MLLPEAVTLRDDSVTLVRPDGLAQIIASFGDPRPLIGYDGLIAPSWEIRQITRVKLPHPLRYAHSEIRRVTCHAKLALIVKDLFEDIDDGKVPRIGYVPGLWSTLANFQGGYQARGLSTGAGLSTHTWGIAFDLVPIGGVLRPEIRSIFAAHGFTCCEGCCMPGAVHFQFATGYGEGFPPPRGAWN